jgi:hypothetical protein
MWWCNGKSVTTLAFGSQPKQRLIKVRAKCEAQESHFMLPRVQESVKEWTLTFPSELPLWELKFQWTPESSKSNCRGQNPLDSRFFYIIGKFLEHTCLKWARITHLNTWNISYGQKKGLESNWQFDSRPLKVKNLPDFHACRRRATYHWKAFSENYKKKNLTSFN